MFRVFQSRGCSSIIFTYSAIARSSLPCRSSFSAFLSASARSMAKWTLDPIKQRRRAERSAMGVGIAEPGHGVEVIASRVALVAVEAVARILPVQLEHRAVARDLGDDRGSGDRGAAGVAVHHTALRHRD